tara:strand:+ start:503 stop:697 length:195 start_codon:yes stop_codon:yes gene_type:complete
MLKKLTREQIEELMGVARDRWQAETEKDDICRDIEKQAYWNGAAMALEACCGEVSPDKLTDEMD